MSNRSLPSTFLKNTAQNGIGRYVCQMQRVTLKFCKTWGGSRGMRDFIENHLLDFVRANPGVVVYLKPRRHRNAVIAAQYLNGRSESVDCNNMDKDEICKWMEFQRTRSGEQIIRFRKPWHTDTPSVQGIWHPFLNKDPSVNLRTFPDKTLSEYNDPEMSATEKLKLMAQQFENVKIVEDSQDKESEV
ncbi:hypothetical protein FSP39_001121 [Pinctada imbricata]|uniref:Large ribosomal subunit protein mL43 n=1 Tax=Pinctada imbricata TaxID=66713 RepID=A0AA88XYB8_PINIB|nr:hypothetical protein FSP39_001121 [Pinctada imbricata]